MPAARPEEVREAKPHRGKEGRKIGYAKDKEMQNREVQAPSVPSKAKQGAEAHSDPRNWTWVEASIWTERMLTALGNGVKGGKWFSLIDKVHSRSTLVAAWKRVAANKGAAGVDGVSVQRFAQRAAVYLEELREELVSGKYKPQPVKRVYIPKVGGGRRPLGIPVVKDRIVQAALKMVLEPIFENEFLPCNYGFRPGKGCKDALREVDELIKEGYTWVVDADLKSYFDTIPQKGMLARVAEKVSDGRVLELLQLFVEQSIFEGLKTWKPTAGTPQGAVISPLLANLYLHPLDVELRKHGHRVVRYADDVVILCRNQAEAERALELVQIWTSNSGLTLHPDKTHLGDCSEPGQGFEFLGYRFEAGNRWVRRKSLNALRQKIRERTRRNRGSNMERIIEDLNPTLRGWFEYFKHAHRWTFRGIDGFVRRRLRSIRRRQMGKQRGTGHCLNDHLDWPNTYFAGLGLFTMHEARLALASQSR